MTRNILFIFLSLLLTGCIGNIDRTHEGSVAQFSEKEIKEKILIGKTTKKDVLKLLGRPNVPLDYNDSNSWTYLSDVTDRRIYIIVPVFLDKKINLNIDFDTDNLVQKITYNEK